MKCFMDLHWCYRLPRMLALPEELCGYIFTFCDQDDLCSLCTVCHAIAPEAERVLYREVTLEPHGVRRSPMYDQQLGAFSRAIVSSPRPLMLHVRCLNVGILNPDDIYDELPVSRWLSHALARLVSLRDFTIWISPQFLKASHASIIDSTDFSFCLERFANMSFALDDIRDFLASQSTIRTYKHYPCITGSQPGENVSNKLLPRLSILEIDNTTFCRLSGVRPLERLSISEPRREQVVTYMESIWSLSFYKDTLMSLSLSHCNDIRSSRLLRLVAERLPNLGLLALRAPWIPENMSPSEWLSDFSGALATFKNLRTFIYTFTWSNDDVAADDIWPQLCAPDEGRRVASSFSSACPSLRTVAFEGDMGTSIIYKRDACGQLRGADIASWRLMGMWRSMELSSPEDC